MWVFLLCFDYHDVSLPLIIMIFFTTCPNTIVPFKGFRIATMNQKVYLLTLTTDVLLEVKVIIEVICDYFFPRNLPKNDIFV